MSAKFTDLFDKIVLPPFHEALTAFENRKAQIASMEVGQLRSATDLLNSVLASLNLPAALEDLFGERVPQSLLEKAQLIQEMGGLSKIDQLMSDLSELLARNKEILNESITALDEEEKSDQQLQEHLKDQWTRTPSVNLTRPMRDEANKYRAILDTAIQTDQIIWDKYNLHKNAIFLLSAPNSELESALPAASAVASLQSSSVVKTLRQLLEQVNTIKAERDVIETELKYAKFDMSGTFLALLAWKGLINEEAISVSELDRVYTPLHEQMLDSIHRQDMLLAQIQNANIDFCQVKASNENAAQRETLLKELAAGFDSFVELKWYLEKGTKFYNDLTPLLVHLKRKITANTPSQAPPVVPRYQREPGQPNKD